MFFTGIRLSIEASRPSYLTLEICFLEMNQVWFLITKLARNVQIRVVKLAMLIVHKRFCRILEEDRNDN